jgi:hypothetical protein
MNNYAYSVNSCAAAAAKDAWFAQQRIYRQLWRRKCCEFWTTKLESERSHPVKLWRSVEALLGLGRSPPSSFIDAESFNKFFVDKVTKVRDATNDAPLPEFTARRPNAALRGFFRISADDVINAVRRLPDKSSAADPIPTFVLKRIVGLIAPYIVELFNRSLEAGQFPICFKEAYITPILKKPGLDNTEVGSYRPISNLPVLSKLLERLVAGQLNNYLSSADLLPPPAPVWVQT